MGDCQIFYNFTVQLNSLCVGGKSKVSFFFITFGFLSLFSFQVFIVLKSGIICTFLIHSGCLQKMLTSFLNLVWNTQRITWTSTKARCFLILKMFWCLNAPHCFFLHIFEVKMSNFYWPLLEKYNKTKLALNSSQNFEAMV